MAGHSKWANIQHRKGAQDAKKAKIFNKFSREIMVLAGRGADPDSNPALRLAIAKAKAQSMPKKNIETAIIKGSGNKSGDNFKEIMYAGNIGGVSFLVQFLSDNANKVASEVQHLFNKANGSVSGVSAVSYIFDRKGILELPLSAGNEDKIMTKAIEAGASDFEASENSYFIYTDPSEFSKVKDELEKQISAEFTTAEVRYVPNQEVKVTKEKAEAILEFIEKLEDNDDVQDVYHNLDPESLEN